MTENKNTEDMAEELKNPTESQEAEKQEATDVKDTAAESAEENESVEAEKAVEEKDPLTELQEKYDTVNNKYLRLYSEFENFRRRTAKEKLETMKNAGSDVVGAIIPVVDDFDRAIAHNENNEDAEALKEGFELIKNKLMRILEQQGLKPMDSIGKPFDTEYHEAITNIPAPSEDMKGKVVDVAEKGYFYNDNILRYAKVIVGQ